MEDTLIYPAILASSEEEYKEKIDLVELNSEYLCNWIQLDMMDNIFVHNRSIETNVVKKYSINKNIEVQLMVLDPANWVEELKGIYQIKRYIAPLEIENDKIEEFINLVRTLDKTEAGLSINPETDLSRVNKFINRIDSVLIMGVHPGFSGQQFIPETVNKVKDVASMRRENNLQFLIGVDGGVSDINAFDLAQAGADYLVVGSHLLIGDIKTNVTKIKKSLQN